MHTIKTWRNPYDEGWSTTRRKEVEFASGVTILVGCNGIGKTTLLHNIESQIKKEDVPCYVFDNLKDGGNNSFAKMVCANNIGMAANMRCSSEGENIANNVGIMASRLRAFLITGEDSNKNPFEKIFSTEKEDITTKERWILLDAIDSGYSIDNVIELKDLFSLVLEDAQRMGCEVYIIASANEYELAADMNCLDVAEGKYTTFNSYEDFRKFILKNREKKDKRLAKN